MDDEPEPYITDSPQPEVHTPSDQVLSRIFLELFTAIGILSIIANVFVCFTILKFRKLRRKTTNVILLHVNVVQAIFLFSTPLTLRVWFLLSVKTQVHVSLFCVFTEIETAVMASITLLLILLIADWYYKTYTDKYEKFCNVYKFFLLAVYIFLISSCVTATQFCLVSYASVGTIVMTLTNLFFLVFLLIMNIVHRIKLRKVTSRQPNNIGLAIANIFVLLWCPKLLLLYDPVLGIIGVTLAFSSPIFNVIYLYICDNDFNIFFKSVIKCRCNDYSNETLDEQTVAYSADNIETQNNATQAY